MAIGQYLGVICGVIGAIIGGVLGGIGTYGFGAPAGASWGFMIGSTIGGLAGQIFWPERANLNLPPPPQPHETRVQFSSWGMAVPIQYGCGRMAGNVIYMSDIKETVQRSRHRQDGVRYYEMVKTYTCTFAISFCEPIENISRIWFNRKVFADYRNPLAPNYPQGDSALSFANWETSIARSEIYYTIYLGSETQGPDPALVALLGAAETPSYRGLTYIVFKDFPVGEFSGLPTIEIESNPVPHGNLIIYYNPKLYLMQGLTGATASEITFPSPYDGGNFLTHNAVTPSGDLAKLFGKYASGAWTWRIYVFVGLSNTVRYYFTIAGVAFVGSFNCEPITGRFIVSSSDGPRGYFFIYEPDGTLVTSWNDSSYPFYPSSYSAGTIIGFLSNPLDPTQPGNMVVLYRNAYLVYYQGYDILFMYESYLGTRIWPTSGSYRVGPISHYNANPTQQPYSDMYFAPARLTSEYIWAISGNLQGYYKFRMSDLINLAPQNVQRVQLPASTYHPLDPPHHPYPSPVVGDGMVMTNGFEV